MDSYLSGFLESLSDTAKKRLFSMLVMRMDKSDLEKALESADSELCHDEVELVKCGKVVDAIRAVKVRTGMTLIDSKRLVDGFRERNGWRW